MVGRVRRAKEGSARAALEDTTVRLVYDMYHMLAGMVEQMQGMDEFPEDDELAQARAAEDTLLGSALCWLQANGVPEPWHLVQ